MFVPAISAALIAAPRAWPEVFTIEFSSNRSWKIAADASRPINGTLFYDNRRRAQRVEHGAGSFECTHFYGTALRCSLLFRADGMYRLLQRPLPPSQPACCLDMPSIHAPPPDWATQMPARDAGTTLVPYTNTSAHEWQYPQTGNCSERGVGSDSGCHSYYEAAPVGPGATQVAPALFTFPANGGLQDWYFDPASFSLQTIPEAVFALPPGCAGSPCPKPSRQGAMGQHSLQHDAGGEGEAAHVRLARRLVGTVQGSPPARAHASHGARA